MERLLLIMPKFMGYESYLKNALEERFHVTYINSDIHDEEILKNYYKSYFKKFLRKIRGELKDKHIEEVENEYFFEMEKGIISDKNAYRYVLCINGHFVPNSIYEYVKKNNPRATFIFYAWDDVKNLFKTSHFSFFDNLYSYNIEDCSKYEMKYLPMFVQGDYLGHKEDIYDIAYIGTAHFDRIKIANKLKTLYSDKYKLYIFLYDPKLKENDMIHNSPLTYDEYLDILSHSKTVLDLPAEIQDGPTTRVFDALMTKTKVISTNIKLRQYPVFSENICIVDRNELSIEEDFVLKEYYETHYKALSVRQWLQEIGLF